MPRVLTLASSLALLLGTVHGVVMRGPITPVCRVGTPCEEPAAHVALDFRRAGRTTRTLTDAHGRYRVRLAAGVYAVTVEQSSPGRGLEPRSVRVRAGRDTRADFHLDTGIR